MGFLSCGKSKCSPHQDINIQSSQEWLHPTWFLQWLQLQPQLLRLALGVPTHPPSPPLHQCQSHVRLRGAPPNLHPRDPIRAPWVRGPCLGSAPSPRPRLGAATTFPPPAMPGSAWTWNPTTAKAEDERIN